MPSLARNITYGEELNAKLDRGVSAVYEVAKAAYGPGAGNALLEINYGYPQISRDGVNNVRKVYLKDPIENMAARTIVLASEASNRKVGDGTTAAVILSYHLYQEAKKLLGAGHNRMTISRLIQSTCTEVLKQLDGMKKEVTPELLKNVATISAGDEGIGDMIADAIQSVGADGGITVEAFDGLGVYSEMVEGFYYRKGFTHEMLISNPAARESRLHDADIVITEKVLKTVADIAPILDTIIKSAGRGAEIVIIGDVEDEAMAVLAENMARQTIRPTLVGVPVHGQMKSLFLADIATITGGVVIPSGSNGSSFTLDMLGGADRMVVNAYSTSIIGGQGAEEDKTALIHDLKEQLKEAESQIDIEVIRGRLSRLTGKIVNIHVGGATPIERDEVKLRVDDAVCAVQAALKGGVVPGGGIALARVDAGVLSDAFKEPFKQLVSNAGFNTEKALFKALEDDDIWQGFDLREGIFFNYELHDLTKVGVTDPTLVIREVVINASSVVSKLITTAVSLTFADREMKND